VEIDYEALLRREGAAASSGAVVAPLLRLHLTEGRFPPNQQILLPGGDPQRKPDGWFHPSSHPTMDARKLYYYMTQPERWSPEPFSPEARMSVTVGTVMHGIVEIILEDLGLWQMPKGTCPACSRPYGRGEGECREPGVADPVLKRRGHMDGVLLTRQLGMVGFDLKTINHFAIGKMPDMDVEHFRIKYPYYYGQMQEYMALSGLRLIIVTFMGMGFPWEYREVHVEYDAQYVMDLEAKYRLVRKAEAEGIPPVACCQHGSKTAKICPAMTCPIKAL
jgi:hypothetical protein